MLDIFRHSKEAESQSHRALDNENARNRTVTMREPFENGPFENGHHSPNANTTNFILGKVRQFATRSVPNGANRDFHAIPVAFSSIALYANYRKYFCYSAGMSQRDKKLANCEHFSKTPWILRPNFCKTHNASNNSFGFNFRKARNSVIE